MLSSQSQIQTHSHRTKVKMETTVQCLETTRCLVRTRQRSSAAAVTMRSPLMWRTAWPQRAICSAAAAVYLAPGSTASWYKQCGYKVCHYNVSHYRCVASLASGSSLTSVQCAMLSWALASPATRRVTSPSLSSSPSSLWRLSCLYSTSKLYVLKHACTQMTKSCAKSVDKCLSANDTKH